MTGGIIAGNGGEALSLNPLAKPEEGKVAAPCASFGGNYHNMDVNFDSVPVPGEIVLETPPETLNYGGKARENLEIGSAQSPRIYLVNMISGEGEQGALMLLDPSDAGSQESENVEEAPQPIWRRPLSKFAWTHLRHKQNPSWEISSRWGYSNKIWNSVLANIVMKTSEIRTEFQARCKISATKLADTSNDWLRV